MFSELPIPQFLHDKRLCTLIPLENYFAQGKEIFLKKNRVAKILSYQPTSTRPWNSQQMAGFAIPLALPTLQGKKNLPTRIGGLKVEEISEKNLG